MSPEKDLNIDFLSESGVKQNLEEGLYAKIDGRDMDESKRSAKKT